MKRITLRAVGGLAVCALALGLAGCGTADQTGDPAQSGTPASAGGEDVTLRMYWWGGDARHQRTQEVIKLFEAKYPNITVKPEFADWNGYWDKLATATAGKTSPDVIQMDAQYLAEYAGRGALTNLSDLEIDTTKMDQSVLDMGTWDGEFYAVPASVASMAVAVNTDLVEEYGVPLPDNTDTWTYEEFNEWAAKVTKAAPDGVYGGQAMSVEFQLQLFARQNGENIFEGNKIVLKPETVEKFLKTDLDWVESGAAAPASVFSETVNLPLDQLPIATGKAVTSFITSPQVSAYSEASGANIDLLHLPTMPNGVEKYDYLKPGMYWTVSSQTEHPAEAALLIDFILNDPEAVKIIGTERGIPANEGTLEEIREDLTPEEIKAVDYVESESSIIGDAPPAPPAGSSKMGEDLIRYVQEVLSERLTPAEAAQQFIDGVQASIDAAN